MRSWIPIAALSAALVMMTADAQAIVRGHGAGAIGRYVVRLVGQGGLSCSATVVGQQEVLTSNHCIDGSDPYFVLAGGRRIKVASHAGDGTAARLVLVSPLPRSYAPIATGGGFGDGGTIVIAGYGTAVESAHPRSGGLRAATLVADGNSGALIDPNRRGASACMGDSGGPVARFDGGRYVLLGIIERASNPSPTRACGDRTHYVSVGGSGGWSGATPSAGTDAPVRPRRHATARPAVRPALPARAMREPWHDRDRGS
jgi:hypothetical protein